VSRRTLFNAGAALCFAFAVALEDGPTWAIIATGLITYFLMDAVDHMRDSVTRHLDAPDFWVVHKHAAALLLLLVLAGGAAGGFLLGALVLP
jgi:hypothetical protein